MIKSRARGGDPAKQPKKTPVKKTEPAKAGGGAPKTDPKKLSKGMTREELDALHAKQQANPDDHAERNPDAGVTGIPVKTLGENGFAQALRESKEDEQGLTYDDSQTQNGVFFSDGEMIFEIHPLAEAYPHMADEIYQPFKEGLLRNGQHQPIDVLRHPTNDKILRIIDGRHRYTALKELDMQVKYKFYEGPDDEDHLREFVESQNVHRRDLTQGQRAMSAAKLYTGKIGRPKKQSLGETDTMTDVVAEEIAKRNGIGLSTFRKAVRVNQLSSRFPDFVEHVFEGRIQLPPAYDMVADFEQPDTKLKTLNITVADFKKVAESPSGIGEILRRQKVAEKNAKRNTRDEKIKEIAVALPDDEYQIVLLDPPWKFEVRSENGMDRAAENHYPTMEIKEIFETKPALADKAVVFLWVTNPFLKVAMDMLDAWDLTYKSHFVWHKDKAGTGYWNRQNHETLIIATTEDGFPAPIMGDQINSCDLLPRGKHSEKPPEYGDWIDKIWPSAKKLEMYCRVPREGWDHWGNESSGVSLLEQISAREDGDEAEERTDEPLSPEERATPLDDANNASQGNDDDDGFFDSANVPQFLKQSKDPLGASDEDEPPGL